MEIDLAWADGLLAVPDGRPPTSAVLVLSGSSGRIERERARLLARHGCAALTFRWFGGAGQPPGICEVPLETFLPALDQLADLSDRVVVLGVSKSAEAALLLAARDPRITADVVLAAGGDDQIWPSLDAARAIAARRSAAGRTTRIVAGADAGHRLILPGELVATGGRRMARGGSEAADRALGAELWPHLLALLGPAVATSPLP